MSRSILKVSFSPRGFLFPMMILITLLAVNPGLVGGLAQAAVSGVALGTCRLTCSFSATGSSMNSPLNKKRDN